ncbi:HtaA domain-containing protein [Microbacterium sediminicola]
MPWAKTAGGSVSVDGTSFAFADGTVSAGADCAVVSFDGWFQIEPHTGFWVRFADPVLTVGADGSGVWSATVTTSDDATGQDLVFATFSGAEVGGPGESVDTQIAFAYDDTTALGTWNASYANAWPNGFVLAAPAAIQAYFYQTSGSDGNLRKPPAPLDLTFDWPAVSETSLSISPETRAVLGDEVSLTATVSPITAEGSVEFFATAAGSSEAVSLGTVQVVDGEAVLSTDELAAGGWSFAAEFTSSNGFAPSESWATENYGIVDTSTPVVCEVAADAVTSTGASASWAFSEYSYAGYMPWAKTAGGSVSVDGTSFAFADGTVSAGADCAVVSFDGWFQIEPHTGFWVRFADPVLTVGADGSGVWSATVTTSDDATGQDLVFATFSGAEVGGPGESVDTQIAFAYDDTTALGTWNASYANAWPNGFVLAAPAAIQAYFYQTSGSDGNLRKPPAPLDLTFDWPAVTATSVAIEPETRAELGEDVTISATVTSEDTDAAPQGEVEFFATAVGTSEATSLGTVELIDGAASLTTASLTAGGHFISATFVPASGAWVESEASYQTQQRQGASTVWVDAAYGIVDLSAPAQCVTGPNAQTSTGATATWDWSAYSSGWTKIASGNVTVADGTFTLTEGVVTADANCAIVEFTGTLRTEAYANFFPPNGQWVELVDPTLYVSADGSGTWVAGVRTGVNTYDDSAEAPRTVVATFSGADVEGAGTTVDTDIDFDYTDTTAAGTWSGTYDDAWSNAFVWLVPSSIQAFYYSSGASGDANKPASPLGVNFTWPNVAVIDGGGSSTDDDVAAGSMSWGVKSSFVSYVTGPIADGSITLRSGATYANGVFQFGQASGSTYDSATGLGNTSYTGSVQFWGHAGELNLTFANPEVRITSANSAQLWVTSNGSRVQLGVISLSSGQKSESNGAVTYANAPVTLTSAGAAAFGGFYSTGTALDPITFTIGSTATAAPSGSTGTVAAASTTTTTTEELPATPPATTGIEVDDDEALESGGTFTAQASGFQPNEQGVQVVVYSTPILLGEATADADGVVTWTGALPATLEDGAHTLTFQGSVDRGIEFTLTRAVVSGGCTVEGATLSWGFKESFRVYIEGIAAGGWELTDVEYVYPDYVWTDGTGAVDTETMTGLVTYGGTIRFTGHEGALDTTISNAQIELAGDVGYVVVDVTGETQDGDAVADTNVRFAQFSLEALQTVDGVLVLDGAESVLTDAGAAAFGTYEAGEALDPVSFSIPLPTDCVTAEDDAEVIATPEATPTEDAGQPASSDASIWWWIIGGLVLLAAIILVWMLLSRRRGTGSED